MGKGMATFSADLWKFMASRPDRFVEVVSNDIPSDAKISFVQYDTATNRFLIAFESEQLPSLEEGKMLSYFYGPKIRVWTKEAFETRVLGPLLADDPELQRRYEELLTANA